MRGPPAGASPKGAGPELYRNRGDGGFHLVTAESGLDRYRDRAFRGATLGDYDNDGDTDFLLTVNGSRPLLFRNQGGNRNRWVKIRLKGTNSNKSGIGTKVEVKSGTLWQKVEVNGGSGFLSQSPPEVLFGLGQRNSVDALRLLWPGGVLQSETDLPVNQVRLVHELDRKGTSCPLLYTWNGRRYQFVTDFLGGCAIGYLLSPGQYNTPDTDEYIRIASSQLKAREGRYSLRINNQLEEVLYIDQAELLVLDHPEELDLYPNERLMPGPPYPQFRIYAARGARPPVSARDHQDRDVLPLISRVDRRYPDRFRLLPFKGYAEEHALVLDLGDLSDRTRVSLLMTAWIDYADSTANYQASQSQAKLVPPYLQVKDQRGDWRTVIPQMGFPAGLPKTMVVDLSGKFLTDDYRVRIVTSMRIYWDRILVNTYPERPTLRQHRLSPQSADLRFPRIPTGVQPRRPPPADLRLRMDPPHGPLEEPCRKLHPVRTGDRVAPQPGRPLRHHEERRRNSPGLRRVRPASTAAGLATDLPALCRRIRQGHGFPFGRPGIRDTASLPRDDPISLRQSGALSRHAEPPPLSSPVQHPPCFLALSRSSAGAALAVRVTGTTSPLRVLRNLAIFKPDGSCCQICEIRRGIGWNG